MSLSLSPPAPRKIPLPEPGWAWLVAVVIAVAVGWLVARGALGRAGQLQWAWGIDGGYFMQRIWQGAVDPFAERTLFYTEAGAGTYGGRHHSPIVSLFIPALALRPHFTTLLVTQGALLGAGVLPLFALCWRCCEDRVVALALLVAALSVPGFFAVGVGDFRLLAPAMVLVPAALGAAVFGPWPAVFAATVLACSVREEIAPLLVVLLPFAVAERAARNQARWTVAGWVPLLAMALPALLWQAGTMWRASLYQPGALSGFAAGNPDGIVATLRDWSGMLASDLKGDYTDPPRVLRRVMEVGGIAGLLLLRKPLAIPAVLLFWVGAAVNIGVVNPGQVHYYAPLVGVFVALVPLSLGALDMRALGLVGAGVLGLAHWLLPALPVSTDDALFLARQPRGPEWEMASTIDPDEVVLASGWLLPTVAPRQEIYCTCDLSDTRYVEVYPRVDVAYLMVGEAFEQEVRDAGFVEVARENQGILLRRPR